MLSYRDSIQCYPFSIQYAIQEQDGETTWQWFSIETKIGEEN